jgi:hypothetical protein
MKIFNPIAVIVCIILLTSCFKEDDKIVPHDPGDVKTQVIELTKDYRYQVYFDLSSEKIISTNLKTEWDLGFECSEKGWHIILNTSNFMLAAKSGLTDFDQPVDTVGYKWNFDVSTGDPDSTAIGQWFEFSSPDSVKTYSNEVYDQPNDMTRTVTLLASEDCFVPGNDIQLSRNLDSTGENAFNQQGPGNKYIYFSFDRSTSCPEP